MSVEVRSGSLLNVSIADSSLAPVIRVASVALTVLLTAFAAQISVPLPLTPVPLVFTPVAVLVCASALGSRLGAIAQVAYVLTGLVGLPVFAPSATLPPGALRLLGPTGGYLMAYPVAAFVTGYLAEHGWDRRYWTSFIALLIGLAIIYTGGVSWLAAAFTHSLAPALTAGLRWFIGLDVLKLAAGAMLLQRLGKLVTSRRRASTDI
jgi:biotin transport system substrate-specific component